MIILQGLSFFAEKIIMVNIYLDTLQLSVFSQLDGIEQEEEGEILFQQDCAPPHFSHEVQSAVKVRFPDPLIGNGGPTLWPPRCTDLSPLDFFCGHLLRNVCPKKIRDLRHLRDRINRSVAAVFPCGGCQRTPCMS
jgi:hypothetical protein